MRKVFGRVREALRPRPKSRTELGRIGEEAAARYLRAKGYRLQERNYRCALGELDLIAWQGKVLAFVEVKTRSSVSFARPVENVTRAKQRKLSRLAKTYLAHRRLDCLSRFDVVEVVVTPTGKVQSIELIPGAFEDST